MKRAISVGGVITSLVAMILVAVPAEANPGANPGVGTEYTWVAQSSLPPGEGWIPVSPAQPQSAPVQQLPPPQPIQSFPAQSFPQAQPIQAQPTQQTPFNLQTALLLRSGDLIVASYGSSERLFVAPGETVPLNVVLDTPLRDAQGNMVVPAGAILEGQFQPVSGGTQFVSRAVTVNGQSYPLYAQSAVVPLQKDPRQTSGEAIVQDALIGAAAGAFLSGIFGSRVISTERVLGGAAAGAVLGNVTAPEVAILEPGAPLNLTVLQDFQPAVR